MVFFRVLKTATPTRWDFLSHAARGIIPRRPLHDEVDEGEWAGVSIYDTLASASRAASRFGLGTHVAVLDVTADDAAQIAPSPRGDPHHYTVWADPERLMAAVREILLVEER